MYCVLYRVGDGCGGLDHLVPQILFLDPYFSYHLADHLVFEVLFLDPYLVPLVGLMRHFRLTTYKRIMCLEWLVLSYRCHSLALWTRLSVSQALSTIRGVQFHKHLLPNSCRPSHVNVTLHLKHTFRIAQSPTKGVEQHVSMNACLLFPGC